LRNELKNQIKDNYTIVPNELLCDDVSAQAKCLYALLASKPNDWTFYSSALADEVGCSVRRLQKYIKELTVNDWVERTQKRGENMTFSTNEYTLKAVKQPSAIKPQAAQPHVGKLPTNKEVYTIRGNNNKEVLSIYSFWNEKKIVLHKDLTDKIKSAIVKAMKEYSVDEIEQAITNYAEILTGSQYFFNYTWTLQDFLARGMSKFCLPPDVVRKNFTGGKNGKGGNISRELPTNYSEPPEYED